MEGLRQEEFTVPCIAKDKRFADNTCIAIVNSVQFRRANLGKERDSRGEGKGSVKIVRFLTVYHQGKSGNSTEGITVARKKNLRILFDF